MGSPAGFKKRCIEVMPTKIGKMKARAKGTKVLVSKKRPAVISMTLIMGKKYRVLANAPIKAPASAVIGGLGIK